MLPHMSVEQDNLAVVRGAYDRYYAGDLDGFFAVFADDVELHEADSLPYGGVYKGIESFKKGIGIMFDAWRDLHFDIEQFTAGGELVIIYMQLRATGKTTGKTFSFPVAEVWRLCEGKVVEMRPIYWDTHRARECFGS
jgi:hypothetical protein